jgi:hypothetical protein
MHIPWRDGESYDPHQSYAAKQLSRYDYEVAGIVVFVVTMTMFFVVALVMMLFRNETTTQAQAHLTTPPRVAVSMPSTGPGNGHSTASSAGR